MKTEAETWNEAILTAMDFLQSPEHGWPSLRKLLKPPQPVTEDLSDQELDGLATILTPNSRRIVWGTEHLAKLGRAFSELRRWRELAKKQESHVHEWKKSYESRNGFGERRTDFCCSCGAAKTETITEKQ